MEGVSKVKKSKKTVVAVSGGFDPIHIGHVRMIREAKKLGDELVVILNNDNWLKAKKGHVFMPEKERKEVIEALSSVDRVILTRHSPNPKDMSVCKALEAIRPDIFANGGDRGTNNTPEVAVCTKIGCAMAFSVGAGGKVQSSSWLLNAHSRLTKLFQDAQFLSRKKVFVFDLDGTLAQSKTSLDAEMAELLSVLLLKRKVAVLGGGDYAQFKSQFLNHLDCSNAHYQNLLLLPVSGGMMLEFNKGRWREVYKHVFSGEEKARIKNAFKKASHDIRYISPKKIYGEILDDRGSQITFSALGQKAPLKAKEEWNKKHDRRAELRTALQNYLPDFEIRLGGLTSVDVTKRGIDKAYGIEQILKLFGVSVKEAVFIGDALYEGGNDHVVTRTGIATVPIKDHEETKALVRSLIPQFHGIVE